MKTELAVMDEKIRQSRARMATSYKSVKHWKDLFILKPDERGTIRAHRTGKLARRWHELKIGLESKHEVRDTVEVLWAIHERALIEPDENDNALLQRVTAVLGNLLGVIGLPLPWKGIVPEYYNDDTGELETPAMPPSASRAVKREAAKRTKKILCDAIDAMVEGKRHHKNRLTLSEVFGRETLMIELASQFVEKNKSLPTKKQLKELLLNEKHAGRLFPAQSSTQWARLFTESGLSELPKG